MVPRIQLSALVLIAFGVWAILLYLSGEAVSTHWLAPYATVITVLVITLAVFDVWVWRWRILQGWFVKRPYLWGTWKVEIRSNWIDPATGAAIDPNNAFMTIRQTYSSVRVRMITEQSAGDLLIGHLIEQDDGAFRLIGVYRNEPRISARDRSAIHYGAFILEVGGTAINPGPLRGYYWTDRGTRGELVVSDRRLQATNSYDVALRLFGMVAEAVD